MIISLSGNMGSGKDSAGLIIRRLLNNRGLHFGKFHTVKFADPLKDCVCLIIGCTREDLEDQNFKNKPLGKEWDSYDFYRPDTKHPLRTYFNYDEAMAAYNAMEGSTIELVTMTPRRMLQLLGTDCGRQIIHENIWVNATMSKYHDSLNWVITDLRFKNEYKAVADKGITIQIGRPLRLIYPDIYNEYGKPDDMLQVLQDHYPDIYYSSLHSSERGLIGCTMNYIVQNDGTMEQLEDKMKYILELEKLL